MEKNQDKEEEMSLFEAFELGDRVVRRCVDNEGEKEFRGIIMDVEKDYIEVYWDTVDGKYAISDPLCTLCAFDEIFYGDKWHSPIEKIRDTE